MTLWARSRICGLKRSKNDSIYMAKRNGSRLTHLLLLVLLAEVVHDRSRGVQEGGLEAGLADQEADVDLR